MKYFSIKPRIHFLQLKKLWDFTTTVPRLSRGCHLWNAKNRGTFAQALPFWLKLQAQPATALRRGWKIGSSRQCWLNNTTAPDGHYITFFSPSGFGLQIRLPQLPRQDCLSSEAFSLYFGLSLCPSQDLQNIHNTSCQECYISLSLSKYDWLAKIKAKLMISSKGT